MSNNRTVEPVHVLALLAVVAFVVALVTFFVAWSTGEPEFKDELTKSWNEASPTDQRDVCILGPEFANLAYEGAWAESDKTTEYDPVVGGYFFEAVCP